MSPEKIEAMGLHEHILTPELKAAITRCTWDSRVNPTVITVWVGDLPVIQRPMHCISAPWDTFTVTFDGGYRFDAENLDPRAHETPAEEIKRRFSVRSWLRSKR